VVTYTRDLAGNIISVSTTDPQGTFQALADQVSYKPFGPMTGLTYGNGLTLTRSFNQSYQMTGYQVPGVLDRTIGYTPDGNIWGIQDNLQANDSEVFDYDVVDQLIGADGLYGTHVLDYDANGNRTLIDRNGSLDEYEVAYYSNRLMETLNGQIQYTYDANGNPVARGTDSFSYDSHNRLKSTTVNGQSASYGYNVNHQRVSKTVGSDTTLYFYGPGGELLAEVIASSGLTSAEYAWLNGEPLAHFRNGNTYFVHNDHLATPQRLTDSAGAVTWSADYEPFGQASTAGIVFNLRFPGQYFDAETELHYNWHRYYDPETGRYITSDPIGMEGGLNTYAYAKSGPLINSDKYGLYITPQTVGGLVGLTVGFTYSYFINDCDFWTSLGDGIQAGAAGFVSGGGSLMLAFSASSSSTAVRSYLEKGEVDLVNSVASGGYAIAGGSVGKASGLLIQKKMVRVERGFFGKVGEKLGLLSPKMIDKNLKARTLTATGVGGVSENAMAGYYSGKNNNCGCGDD
jgi:RHS repeat-associated protein